MVQVKKSKFVQAISDQSPDAQSIGLGEESLLKEAPVFQL